ncbi:MAG: SpoIIE family protein phosphatase [Candidatus Ornithospirochaeta sp.]|nr:SpoIIE family protein phosphatase [Candidatus Ornithospirochaeta sp.]
MNNIFIDVDYAQIFKHGQKIGGDVFLLSRNPEKNQIVSTLSDGLGSGVKANVLASLTAHMAHKLSFSPIDLNHSAKIIMDTLPVCKERKISYSTFTIADIRYKENNEDIEVNLVEYDNPPSLRFAGTEPISWQREKNELQREGAFKKEVVSHSSFSMAIGERLIMFSDGVTQSGLGKSLPLGWRIEGVRKFVKDEISKNPDISSRDLSRAIVQKACTLDGLCSKDDITCVVVYIRRPRRTLIVTGPPFTKEADEILGQKIREFDGRKIVSGGTTAQIVSRLFGKKLTVDLKCWSKDVPPSSKMEGIDLVTEGMLTLSKVATILEKKEDLASMPDNPAKRFVEILLDSDQVHFLVGTKINEAHQDPNIPVEIGIRRTIIGRLRKALEEIYLKETSQEYL